MKVRLIFAASLNNIIGKKGRLPWHIPDDLRRFKRLTEGSTVVMGRKTYESLPDSSRPLQGRKNIVITSNEIHDAGVVTARSLIEVIDLYKERDRGDLWVMGGERLLQEAILYADELYLTRVFKKVEGDKLVKGPSFNFREWVSDYSSSIFEDGGVRYQFVNYLKNK